MLERRLLPLVHVPLLDTTCQIKSICVRRFEGKEDGGRRSGSLAFFQKPPLSIELREERRRWRRGEGRTKEEVEVEEEEEELANNVRRVMEEEQEVDRGDGV